jgi:Tol biopolymer transport system component
MTPDARYVVFHSASTYVLPDDNFASDVFVRDRLFGTITRASVNSNGDQAEPFHAVSGLPDISADGRYVVFSSEATNLVDDDTNGDSDVFVHDLVLGSTSRVSVSTQGTQAHGPSFQPRISADGRYVVFRSIASDLVPGSGPSQIFVRDLVEQTTELASKDSSGVPAVGNSMTATISGDGRYVFFASDAKNLVADDVAFIQLYRHDRITGNTILVSRNSMGEVGDYFSQSPATTSNGRYAVFESWASNLGGVDTNNSWDIFWHDCDTGVTRRVSTDALGTQGLGDSQLGAITDDGDFIAFTSKSTNWTLGGGTYDIQGYSVFFAPMSLFADGFEH